MKIQYENFELSLFETEYKEVSIEENCIKVISLEGKVKKICFQLSKKVPIDTKVKTKAEGSNAFGRSSPKTDSNLTTKDDTFKAEVHSTKSNPDQIKKLRTLIDNLDLEVNKKFILLKDLTTQISDIETIKLRGFEEKVIEIENTLKDHTQSLTSLNDDIKAMKRRDEIRKNGGGLIDMELLKRVEESANWGEKKDHNKKYRNKYY